jgi:hypothetical protein
VTSPAINDGFSHSPLLRIFHNPLHVIFSKVDPQVTGSAAGQTLMPNFSFREGFETSERQISLKIQVDTNSRHDHNYYKG